MATQAMITNTMIRGKTHQKPQPPFHMCQGPGQSPGPVDRCVCCAVASNGEKKVRQARVKRVESFVFISAFPFL